MEAKFEKQTYGAVVATILETKNSIVEVQERNDGTYGLIVHHRFEYRDNWDDLTAYLKPEHFDTLGSVARRMRGKPNPDTEDRLAEEGSSAPAYSSEALYLAEQIILATGGDPKRAREVAVMLDVFATKGMINPERERQIRDLVGAVRKLVAGHHDLGYGDDLANQAVEVALAPFAGDR